MYNMDIVVTDIILLFLCGIVFSIILLTPAVWLYMISYKRLLATITRQTKEAESLRSAVAHWSSKCQLMETDNDDDDEVDYRGG